MLNTLKANTELNGYKITALNGGQFVAKNELYDIVFLAEGRNGGLYTKVLRYTNKSNNRTYQGQRFLFKFIGTVQGLGFQLGELNYLWDYKMQVPFLQAKIDTMKKVDQQRSNEGKMPLYAEYLNK